MPRGRYTGGWGLLSSCSDGDCMALDALALLQEAFEEIDETVSNRKLPVREQIRRRKARRSSPQARSLVRGASKPRRRVSAYQKEFGRQLKKLKKKHPRTPTSKLMKRAHAATKRARRGK